MGKEMNCELTNMIMIENPENGMVLAQKRVKYWCGVTFPGGHVEKGESFTESAIREAKEETGLDIKNPVLCGTVHWCNKETDRRYIVLLFKTNEYGGEIVDATDEGEIFWINKLDFAKHQLSPHFDTYLKIFLSDKTEAFGMHDDNSDDEMLIF